MGPHADFAERFTDAVADALRRGWIADDSQAALADLMSVSGPMIWAYRNGEKLPRIAKLKHIASVLGVTSQWLFEGSPPRHPGPVHDIDSAEPMSEVEPGSIQVPQIAATASMGEGIDVPLDDVLIGALRISREWARQNLGYVSNPERLRFITGMGDSMTPTFRDGDILLVDTGISSVTFDGVYVLSAHARLFIKRVRQRLDGKFEISSDNPSVKTTDTLNGDHEVTVHGRVVWAWNGSRL